jgi:hypothetical protein
MAAFGLSVLGWLIAIAAILFGGYITIGLTVMAWEKITRPFRPKSLVDLMYERKAAEAEAEKRISERYGVEPKRDKTTVMGPRP